MSDRIGTFLGKGIETMTREELLGVIQYFAARDSITRSPSYQRAMTLGRIEMMKRGEVFLEEEGKKS